MRTTQARSALNLLERCDTAGDQRGVPLEELLAQWPAWLTQMQPLTEACGARLLELADKPAESASEPAGLRDTVRKQCGLAMRALPIVQRQVVGHARTFLGLPSWVLDVPKRYAEVGRVGWSQLLDLLDVEASYERRAAPWLRAAAQVGAVLPVGELLGPGVQARQLLLREIDKGISRLGWPLAIEDASIDQAVRAAWREARPDGVQGSVQGPRAWSRSVQLLAVRAVDVAWQPLVDERGRKVREQREFAALVRVEQVPGPLVGCWISWGTVERRTGPTEVRWSDDARKVRCPASEPRQSGILAYGWPPTAKPAPPM